MPTSGDSMLMTGWVANDGLGGLLDGVIDHAAHHDEGVADVALGGLLEGVAEVGLGGLLTEIVDHAAQHSEGVAD
eukprot:3603313-Alexandrium_andersonii.AAC.1